MVSATLNPGLPRSLFHFAFHPHPGPLFVPSLHPASCAAAPLEARRRSPYRLTMAALFHRPACRIAARPIPEAIMSWAAPTRALCPDSPPAKSSEPRPDGHGLVDPGYLARVESAPGYAVLADRPEQGPSGDSCCPPAMPSTMSAVSWARKRMFPAPSGSVLALRRNRVADPPWSNDQVGHLQGDQLRAPEHGVVGHGQQGPVPYVDKAFSGYSRFSRFFRRANELLPDLPGEAEGLGLSSSLVAVHAPAGPCGR